MQNDIPFKAIKQSPNALFRCAPLPRLRNSTFHETYIYIYELQHVPGCRKHLKSRHAEWRASENRIWAYVYSFKKVVRLHFPRCRLRDPSKISIIPTGKSMILTCREKISACETIDFPKGKVYILRPRGGDPAKSANGQPF